MTPSKRFRARVGVLVASAMLLSIPLAGQFAGASSHREAPRISNDPAADTTDMYVFRSPDAPSTVTAIMNVWPFGEPSQGPNWYLFDPTVRYSMHITNDGDAEEEIRLDFRFRTEIRGQLPLLNGGAITSLDDPDFLTRQFYSVDLVTGGQSTRLGENLPVPPPNAGPKTFPNGYEQVANAAIVNIPSIPGGKVFAGPRDDPFFIDIGAAFDLFNTGRGIPTGAQPGVDNLSGFNVLSLAVQVPIAAVVRPECDMSDASDMDCVVGMWLTTSRPRMNVLDADPQGTTGGAWPFSSEGDLVQVSRLSAALVNELVVPTESKDIFNASMPSNDEAFLPLVQDPIPAKLLNALFGLNVPPAPRQDVVTIFLTGIEGLNQPPNVEPAEIAHLNLAIPATPQGQVSRLGVLGGDLQGYPNGRRLFDDVTDITLRVAAGGTPFTPEFNVAPNNALSDGVNTNDVPFLTTFPYVAAPHAGYQHRHGVLAGAAVAAPAQPAAPPRTGNSGSAAAAYIYTVQEGDTLASISEAVYGTAELADEILAHNMDVLANGDVLEVGMVLTLPSLALDSSAGG